MSDILLTISLALILAGAILGMITAVLVILLLAFGWVPEWIKKHPVRLTIARGE